MAGKAKRANRVVREFLPCDRKSVMTIETCHGKGKLGILCKFVEQGTCVFKVSCTLTATGWNCGDLHRFHILHCCDYTCKK